MNIVFPIAPATDCAGCVPEGTVCTDASCICYICIFARAHIAKETANRISDYLCSNGRDCNVVGCENDHPELHLIGKE